MAGLDPALVDRIEKLAQYVAQTNGAMENIARERYRTNPDFAFLFGGDGAASGNFGASNLGMSNLGIST